ncbi:MAG: hypothetical protein IT186_23265 [Acidobacteria bacterium]|nr:hypothetical protein [Acidobacteriota bacterium]
MRTRLVVPALALLLSTACRREAAAPPQAAPAPAPAPAPAEAPPAAPAPAAQGGEFNRFFPAAKTGPLERVFTQEKTGFALAEITRDGKKVALLSIVDLVASGEGAPAQSSRALAGFPVVDTGSMQTSAIVASRFKVVARSTDPGFTREDRDNLIKSVDLSGLAALAGGKK